jgi:hypothetical protein
MLMKSSKQIMRVPRLSLRLELIVFQREFEDQLTTILPDLKVGHIGCQELRKNQRLDPPPRSWECRAEVCFCR